MHLVIQLFHVYIPNAANMQIRFGFLGALQGDPSACGKGYVDISSDSYRGYPETELMST